MSLSLLVAAWFLVLVAWLVLYLGILPHIEQWRDVLEVQASRALGVSVKLGRIEVRSSGWVPSIELGEVKLLDAKGQPALVLPRVTAAVSPQSLLRLELRFAQLVIEGAHLEVKREASGRIVMAGLDAGAQHTGGADWLFKQTEFVIRKGSVRWLDEQRNMPPLLLSDVQLVVRNGLLRHDLRLDATPPALWGERFSLRGRFTQPLLARAGQWERWSGQVYADFPRADVQALGNHVDLPVQLSQGLGALRAWGQLRQGQLESVTVDVALQAVQARLAPELQALRLQQVQGRFLAKRGTQTLQLDAQQLSFTMYDGLSWPASSVSVLLEQRGAAPATSGRINADALDLGLLAHLALHLPLGDKANQWLRDTAPQGQVQGLELSWRGPADNPQTYQVKAQLQALSLASGSSADLDAIGRPGVHNARVDVQANQAGGRAAVNLDQGWLELPGVFSDPVVPLLRLSAVLDWRIELVQDGLPKVSVQWSKAQFANADVQGEVTGVWRTGGHTSAGTRVEKEPRFPGHLVLDGKLIQGDLAQLARYTPKVIPEEVRDYLGRALTQGTFSDGIVRVQGNLAKFPFVHARTPNEGEFRISGKVAGATFAYAPSLPALGDTPARSSPWPALNQVSGEVAIDRDRLYVRSAQAAVMGVALRKINGQMRDLLQPGQATLQIEGQGGGELAQLLQFVETTPVARWTGNALASTTAVGASDFKLNLTIPVFNLTTSTVQGSVVLLGNDVQLRPELPLLAAVRGRVDFSNTGFSIVSATARVFGGDVSFSGGSQADRSVRISGQGQASAEAIRALPDLVPLSRLAGYFSGQTGYRLDLGWRSGRTEVSLSSNLVGWSSQLPVPLRKASATAWPLRFQTRLLPDAQGTTTQAAVKSFQDSVQLDLGLDAAPVLRAQYVREWLVDAQQAAPRILRGALGVGVPAPAMPSGGVLASLQLPTVDVDAWADVQSQVFGASTSEAQEFSALGAYAPTQIAVKADGLTSRSFRLNEVDAQARWERGQWRALLTAQQAKGELAWRPETALQAGHLQARFSRLVIEPGTSTPGEQSTPPRNSVPSLDVVVDDFQLRGKPLGRLEVQASQAMGGAASDWRLQHLALTTPEAKLSATGQWVGLVASAAMPLQQSARQTQMEFKLQISDAGALLDRLGLAKALRGGKGELTGQLRWSGSPLSPDPLSMSGDMVVNLASGQFLKVDPGAARLLGVLSLQSLPRRLLLDFRDVFEAGFVFDNIDGNVSMNRGVAATNNLRIRGVQAAVLMEGTASLIDETQDLRVVVLPDLNAGTASLAYVAINPALGLGTFLAQLFLRKSLSEANTREFHVTGAWTDPKYTRIQRSAQALETDEASDDLPASVAPNKP